MLYFITGISKSYDTCFGFSKDLDAAIDVVKNNCTDLHEMHNNYIVIEEIDDSDGYLFIYPEFTKEYWFEYDEETDLYHEIEKPQKFKNTCNYSM